QVNRAYPNRSKRDDGWIGDDAHAARVSDHNPNRQGVVTALDLTHDPRNGFDSYEFADMLKANRDPRIKYLISNRRISNPSKQNGAWRVYDGANPHTRHVHISVSADPALYDDPAIWDLSTSGIDADFGQPQRQESGRGSWYSQYSGNYTWVDPGDKAGSSALGVPDSAQGCAFYNRSTLGDWFVVTAPNGRSLRMPQTDIGPHPNTGRKIDISAHMAEAFGYTPRNFPTDGIFKWVPAAPPVGLEDLTPKQQAIRWAQLESHPPEEKMPGRPDDTSRKPQPMGNPLLLILLLILSKQQLMAGDPAKPRQGIDIEKVLLPLLLQSATTGKLIDIGELLSVAVTGKPSTLLMPPVGREPLQQPTDINTMLVRLLYEVLTGKPWPDATPLGALGKMILRRGSTGSDVVFLQQQLGITADGKFDSRTEAAVCAFQVAHGLTVDGIVGPQTWGAFITGTAGKSAMSRPSVQLSVGGLALSTILQGLGYLGTPFGMGQSPTQTGTLATLIPILTGTIGATGGFGALANIGLKLLSGFKR